MRTYDGNLWQIVALGLLLQIGSRGESYAQVDRIEADTASQRRFEVADSIEMARYGDSKYLAGVSARYTAVQWSPAGTQFTFVSVRGNLVRGTSDYSLLLFSVNSGQISQPRTLLNLSSSSARPAIQQIVWLDEGTLTFLGEHPGELQQVYLYRIASRQLRRLTEHPTNVLSYAIPRHRRQRLIYTAERPPRVVNSSQARRRGIQIVDQWLPDLIAGSDVASRSLQAELFIATTGVSASRRRVALANDLPATASAPADLFVSPNGKYVVLPTLKRNVPRSWSTYDNFRLQLWAATNGALQMTLVDVDRGTSEPLINAPTRYWFPKAAWTADSSSVIVVGTFLPLGDAGKEHDIPISHLREYVAEVSIADRKVSPIAEGSMKLLRWESASKLLVLQELDPNLTSDLEMPILSYHKTDGVWRRADAPLGERPIEVLLDEDLNTPPRLLATVKNTGRQEVFFDLNPQLRQVRLASVEEIRFTTRNGDDVTGGLYLPRTYQAGQRLPLVIQTHGWNPSRFWPDGAYTSASAAQALTSRNIIVLQLAEDDSTLSSAKEGPRHTDEFEAAIEYLVARGLVNPTRVGLVGFSRTCFHVKYALTHSSVHFAAAIQADCTDGGYFQYVSWANHMPAVAADFERLNGGNPFGTGRTSWLQHSPSFRLERVNAPVRLETYEAHGLFTAWEWFVGLKRLNKPVELIYIPNGEHVLIDPWQRMLSQQGTVDWFDFWLNGHEDPDPAKAEQYARWRQLRKLQGALVKPDASSRSETCPGKRRAAPPRIESCAHGRNEGETH